MDKTSSIERRYLMSSIIIGCLIILTITCSLSIPIYFTTKCYQLETSSSQFKSQLPISNGGYNTSDSLNCKRKVFIIKSDANDSLITIYIPICN